MKKSLFVFALAGILTAACGEMPEPELIPEQGVEGKCEVRMTAAPVIFADATKSTMVVNETTGLSFLWADGDKAGVSAADVEESLGMFSLTSGGGTGSAVFDGGGFTLTDTWKYYAFFPYNGSASNKKAIPLNYASQVALADNDVASPMARDYMWAEAVSDKGNAQFSFAHVGSFVRVRMSGLTEGQSVSKVQLIPMYDGIVQTATYDITTQSITPTLTHSSLDITTTGVTVPSGGTSTVWAMMVPHDFSADAVAVAATVDGVLYSGRLEGVNQIAGKAYRWNVPTLASSSAPELNIAATPLDQVQMSVEPGNYSGIYYLGDNGGTYNFAVVDDKLNGGGIVFFTIPIDDDGIVIPSGITMTVPTGTSSGAASADNEDVVFDGSALWVSAEDQTIRKFNVLDGSDAADLFTTPADMGSLGIVSNAGFEALTYDASTGRFWTTTELPLKKDSDLPRLHRLQRFSSAHEPDARYLYQMDEPTATAADIASSMAYVFGIPAMAALGDGRLIVLEREVFVPSSTSEILAKTFANVKLYVVDPANDGAGILRKKLLTQFSTGIDSFFSASLANYEGMCLGPVVGGKQSLVLIADSQKGMKKTVPYIGEVTLTHEYVKVILLENL